MPLLLIHLHLMLLLPMPLHLMPLHLKKKLNQLLLAMKMNPWNLKERLPSPLLIKPQKPPLLMLLKLRYQLLLLHLMSSPPLLRMRHFHPVMMVQSQFLLKRMWLNPPLVNLKLLMHQLLHQMLLNLMHLSKMHLNLMLLNLMHLSQMHLNPMHLNPMHLNLMQMPVYLLLMNIHTIHTTQKRKRQ